MKKNDIFSKFSSHFFHKIPEDVRDWDDNDFKTFHKKHVRLQFKNLSAEETFELIDRLTNFTMRALDEQREEQALAEYQQQLKKNYY